MINKVSSSNSPTDYFSDQANKYSAYRPHYPKELFQFLAQVAPASDVAWDCGTGNGQAAFALAEYFKYVVATDSSEAQLKAAEKKPNIFYVASTAENTAFSEASIDLICIAQALHWFNLKKFYKEVNRLAKIDSIIAAWCYSNSFVDKTIDEIINTLYNKITEPEVLTTNRLFVLDKYQTIPFPFQRLKAPNFLIRENWTLSQFVGYLNTWPGVKDYVNKHGINPVQDSYSELGKAWGHVDSIKTIEWPIYLLVGKVNKF